MATGEFDLPSPTMRVGIRQDVSDLALHGVCLRNANWRVADCLTKDRGLRAFCSTAIGTGTTYGAFEARFSNGTQKLLAFQQASGACAVVPWNATTETWDTALATTLEAGKPWAGMFANKAVLLDGNQLYTYDSATAADLTTVAVTDEDGEAVDFPNRCTWGVVYANRLVLFGDPQNPFYFWPSEVRTLQWDATIGYSVMSTRGERIKGACTCGPYLLVGGDEFLRAFYLGTAGPEDWDWDSLSEEVGPVNWQSMVQVSRGYGNQASSFTFFWGKQGPMMVAHMGSGLPTLVPLWRQIQTMLRGTAANDVPGLDPSCFNSIEAAYALEYDEVRFTCRYAGSTSMDLVLCVDVTSCVAMMTGASAYPLWRIRDNADLEIGGATRGLPASSICTVELDPDTGDLSTEGTRRCLLLDAGMVYEMDGNEECMDLVSQAMPMTVTIGGISGAEQGMRDWEKVIRKVHLHYANAGAYQFIVTVIGDSNDFKSATVPETGVFRWGEGMWGTGMWTDGAWQSAIADMGCRGHVFQLRIYDDGAVLAPASLSSWMLYGYVEGRR